MAAKSTASFFNGLQDFEKELVTRAKELRYVAEREKPEQMRRSTRLIWLDELESLQEVLTTQAELSRSTVQLDTLFGFAEVAADALEAALSRAEDLAVERYGYEQPATAAAASKTPKKNTKPMNAKETPSGSVRRASRMTPRAGVTPQHKTPRSQQRARTRPNAVNRLSDPPTPNMDDLGLSSAAMSLLKGM